MSYSRLWVDKYLPINSNEIIGNSKEIKSIRNWINHFKGNEIFPNFKNGLLLSGKPGIGKTTMAHILLKEAGYDIIEFNASEVRSQKVIRDKLLSIINGSNILKMINQNKKIAIIMDEVDGSSTGEKGVIKDLVQYISNANNYAKVSSKKGKVKKIRRKKSSNKDIIVNNNPLICICNQIVTGMKALKTACVHLKISVPNDENIFQLIKKIKQNENINMNDIVCRTIVPHCQMDIRRTINILENIKIYFKNAKITLKDINRVIKSFGHKDIDVGLYTAINNIFGNNISINDSLINFQSDKVFVPMLIHENFNKQIRNNFKNSQIEKLDSMYQYYNFITDANIIENELYHTHNWELSDYIGILTCYSANNILNSLNPYEIPKYNTINNSPVLSKINYKFYNLKIINLFCKKINISTNNFQQFTQYIYNIYIFNIYDENTTLKITKYLAKYLEFVDIDKCIKLSYLYQEYIKLYTSKIKKKIEKTFQNIKNKYT
jgi:replication factor C subunit 1